MSFIRTTVSDPDELCGICIEPLIEDIWTHDVHRFHGHCITDWTKRKPTCPTCRAVVDTSTLLGNKVLEGSEPVDKGVSTVLKGVIATAFTLSLVAFIYKFGRPEHDLVSLLRRLFPGFYTPRSLFESKNLY